VDGESTSLTLGESELLGILVRDYGWYWLDAGLLKRSWDRHRVHCFMNPEGK
jgi:hypothetical protein